MADEEENQSLEEFVETRGQFGVTDDGRRMSNEAVVRTVAELIAEYTIACAAAATAEEELSAEAIMARIEALGPLSFADQGEAATMAASLLRQSPLVSASSKDWSEFEAIVDKVSTTIGARRTIDEHIGRPTLTIATAAVLMSKWLEALDETLRWFSPVSLPASGLRAAYQLAAILIARGAGIDRDPGALRTSICVSVLAADPVKSAQKLQDTYRLFVSESTTENVQRNAVYRFLLKFVDEISVPRSDRAFELARQTLACLDSRYSNLEQTFFMRQFRVTSSPDDVVKGGAGNRAVYRLAGELSVSVGAFGDTEISKSVAAFRTAVSKAKPKTPTE